MMACSRPMRVLGTLSALHASHVHTHSDLFAAKHVRTNCMQRTDLTDCPCTIVLCMTLAFLLDRIDSLIYIWNGVQL